MEDKLNEAQQELLALMGELSDRYCFAHWLDGLEYYLWYAVLHGPKVYGFAIFRAGEIETLSRLSRETGGWFWSPPTADSERFLSLEEWNHHYVAWAAQWDEQLPGPGVQIQTAYTFRPAVDPAAFHRFLEEAKGVHLQKRLEALQSLAGRVVENASPETRRALKLFGFTPEWLDSSNNEQINVARWYAIALTERLRPAPSLSQRGGASMLALYSLQELAGWSMDEVLALLCGQPFATLVDSSPLALVAQARDQFSGVPDSIGWLDLARIASLYERLLPAEPAFAALPEGVTKGLVYLASLWDQSPAELLRNAYAAARKMLETALARKQALLLINHS